LLDGSEIACVAASGAREVVPFAPSAAVAVVVAGDSLLAGAPGSVPAEPAMDCTREAGWLDPATLGGSDVLGGADGVARPMDVGATLYAAELLGLSARMLDVTVEYAKDRVQFDRPIGSFQAVKHRCADMLVDVEGMRSAVYWAAWCLGAGDPDTS